MPVYEYQCQQCDKRFEALRPMSQMDAPAECPRCGASDTRRAISVFAAVSRGADGGSRMIASSAPGGGCAGCAGGHCGSCSH
ncbi:MAG: zinc ribbon domain-containing protein [Anaerolineae bacterium]|jgi:putative FmdB family regulatory protein|nr:zinc ribbon domain-containing protein [Anaerolineae bacterium]